MHHPKIRRHRALRHIVAVGICGLGTLGVMALMVWMNTFSVTPSKAPVKEAVAIQVAAPQPKPKKARPAPKPKPRQAKRIARRHTPPPILATGLSGIDLGMGGAPTGAVKGLGDSLIGDPGKTLVMTEDAVDSRPRRVRCPPAAYPQSARAKGLKGHVSLRLLIGQSGNVERVKIADSEPPGVFDSGAIEAMQQCRFEPATYQGQPVKVWARQRVNFKLAHSGISG